MADETTEMFSTIARRYDLLNRILSWGLDEKWRRQTAEAACPRDGSRILDICTGTAGLALSFFNTQPRCRITGIDLSSAMLDLGNAKINANRGRPDIFLGRGNALDLPFEDSSFDITATAFGFRNIPDRSRGLREMRRVTKKGGRILILEFSPPQNNLFSAPVRFYISRIVPLIGGWMSRSAEAYAYLASSIISFLSPQQVCSMMREAALIEVTTRYLGAGAHLYAAVKP